MLLHYQLKPGSIIHQLSWEHTFIIAQFGMEHD